MMRGFIGEDMKKFRLYIAKKILGESYFVGHRQTARLKIVNRLETVSFVARSLIDEIEA